MKGLEKATGLVTHLNGARFHTYEELVAWSGKTRRTVYRWIKAIREEFGEDLEQKTNEEGRKAFRLRHRATWLDLLTQPRPEDVAALDVAIKAVKGRRLPTDELRKLRDRLTRVLELRKRLGKVETDVEAELNRLGLSFRPGPRFEVDPDTRAKVRHAILALNKLRFRYKPHQKPARTHTVIPWGVLIGSAPQLVAMPEGSRGAASRPYHFRLDRMSDLEEIPETGYEGPPEGAFREYRKTIFDSFAEEPFDVEWRFHQEAPQVDRWEFHSDQELETEPDGSVVVRFRAGGREDMARHLIGWGDWVTGIRPKALREAVFRLRLAGLAPLIEEFGEAGTARRIARLASESGANRVRPESEAAEAPDAGTDDAETADG